MDNTTVVIASYFLCDTCEHDWHVCEAERRIFMACDRCGRKCESYESEEVDA
jgi:hypothetical protein